MAPKVNKAGVKMHSDNIGTMLEERTIKEEMNFTEVTIL